MVVKEIYLFVRRKEYEGTPRRSPAKENQKSTKARRARGILTVSKCLYRAVSLELANSNIFLL
jgi:hypothetical protein